MNLFFSDYFGVTKDQLDEYGAVDLSLVSDIPLFVDPFLLFNSEDEVYRQLHDDIINYLGFLRDKSTSSDPSKGQLQAWYTFGEVKQNWLGFTLLGNGGSGLGTDFAKALHENLHRIFHDFSDEAITAGSHLEKLCLIKDGVGRDNISDFTTNLIKDYLLKYTQRFAVDNIDRALLREVRIRRAYFNYDTETWADKTYTLPYFWDDYIILTPKAILTKDDTWINKTDLVNRFTEIPNAISDEQLREQVSNYFYSALPKRPSAKDRREATIRTLHEFPDLIDYYIKLKEDTGEQANRISVENVEAIEGKLLQAQELLHALTPEFARQPAGSLEEVIARANYLKHCIEERDGYRIINHRDSDKPSNEKIVQLLFILVWFGSEFDLNREVNNGRGPVDYTSSFGAKDKTIIEFKLGSNPQLKQGLEKQTEVYLSANNTTKKVVIIVCYTEKNQESVNRILNELGLQDAENIILIDARNDNKPSASNS
jgi:hypothetical protein